MKPRLSPYRHGKYTSYSQGCRCDLCREAWNVHQRAYRDAHRVPRHEPTDEEFFWARVEKGEGCWEWQGRKLPGGYGESRDSNRERRFNKKAHRQSWEIHHGPIPDGLLVLHRCDNPPCVRPDHLFLGTNADNMRDMARKARRNKKLTPSQVEQIRVRYAQGGVSQEALGKEYGVCQTMIGFVVRGEVHVQHEDLLAVL